MQRFPEAVEQTLRASGWQPGRAVDTSEWRRALGGEGFRMHSAAERFLSEFGGLTVDIGGPGISCARTPFELDPALAVGEHDRFSEWGEGIFPLGELDRGRFFLGISESGEIHLVSDWLASFGAVPEALERLILGIAPDVIEE